jgi:hypothetical protein
LCQPYFAVGTKGGAKLMMESLPGARAHRIRVNSIDDIVGTILFIDGGMTLYPGCGANG